MSNREFIHPDNEATMRNLVAVLGFDAAMN